MAIWGFPRYDITSDKITIDTNDIGGFMTYYKNKIKQASNKELYFSRYFDGMGLSTALVVVELTGVSLRTDTGVHKNGHST